MDLEYVAKKKVEEAYKQLGKPIVVDDVGLYVDAWNGFPGPYVKHMLDALDYSGLLGLLKNEKNRRVRVAAVIGYHDGKKAHTFIGKFNGTLSTEKRGTKGWGFDPIVIPDGFSETFAELGPDIKNKISHRALALKKFKKFLDKQK
jgi:XTP/dITP diphosphohydrolase